MATHRTQSPLAALGVTATACTRNSEKPAAGSSDISQISAQPVDLTGCLQEGTQGTYILTELNAPKQPDSSNPSLVEREKLAAAEAAYRLTSNRSDELAKLVGTRVHVNGMVTRRSDLIASVPEGQVPAGTTGQTSVANAIASGRVNVEEKDLAEVSVGLIEKVANACGTQ